MFPARCIRTALAVRFSSTHVNPPIPLCHMKINLFSTSPFSCWKCGQSVPRNSFQCPSCSSIQDPVDVNYFNVFGIEENYNVDKRRLTTKFRQLQSKFHPDKFSQRSDREKDISMKVSSELNKAYNTLVDPYKRGKYLLSLKSIPDNDSTEIPGDFYPHMMELNEKLMTIKDRHDLNEFESKNNIAIEALANEVKKHFEANNLNEAKMTLLKMKFYTSIADRIKKIRSDSL